MGKTTVSNMFRDLGVKVWCADNEVNELYKINGAATKILSNEFPSVVTNTGVDKKKQKEKPDFTHGFSPKVQHFLRVVYAETYRLAVLFELHNGRLTNLNLAPA